MTVSPEIKIIFVHGWATDSNVWSNQVNHLAKYFHCECLNLLGHDRKSKSNDCRESTHSKSILHDLLNRVEYDSERKSIIGVGWSLGAELLLEIAISNPDMFRGLVLIGATPSFVKRKRFPWGKSVWLVRQMQKNIADSFTPTLNRFYSQNFTKDELGGAGARSFISYYMRYSQNFHRRHLLAALSYLTSIDFRMMVRKIRIPVLILHGGMDRIVPVEAGRILSDGIANSHFQAIAKAGHAPFITAAEQVNLLIHGFILYR